MIAALGRVRLWALVYAIAGATVCVMNLSVAGAPDTSRFMIYLLCAHTTALVLRVTTGQGLIPGAFLILLLGIEDLSLPELLFIGFTLALLNELRRTNVKALWTRLLYATTTMTLGVAMAHAAYHATPRMALDGLFPAPVIASALALLFNCGVATTLWKDRTTPLIGVYRRECRALLYWVVGAAYLASLVRCASLQTGFHAALIATPILFALDRCYRKWSNAEANHRAELEALHLRTLETLAVAIDTRDHTTQMHLRRVQTYAMALGREIGLNETELRSLNVAALLHDIGKLGIPDHILLKPGPLSVEEWEKMKTHPILGAEMLSRMKYPEPVLAIVKAHHERWDGTGYPMGLSGETIPIGARILSAVDCLDALASDRPYRNALPLSEAMDRIKAGKDRNFDPAVIAVLERRYTALEQQARDAVLADPILETLSPAANASQEEAWRRAGLGQADVNQSSSFHESIMSARQETLRLQQLASDLAQALGIDEVVSSVDKCLSQLVRYDTMAVYLSRGRNLELVAAVGASSRLFSRQAFPMTNSLSGWAIQNRTPVVNGDVAQECYYVNDSKIVLNLQAALVVPFEGRDGVTGAITLYHGDRNAFSQNDLRVVQAASSTVGRAVESAVRYQHAEESAVTDHLTGIANARSLALHLERELSRSRREDTTIGVLVCDLDGFKQVNDLYGHLKGNEVLQLVAKGLTETCRSSDYLARMGGDEFVIVVPGLKEDQCASYLDRLQTVAREAGWTACGSQCLSISVGLAMYPFDGRDSETLLAEADKRMYRAKQTSKESAEPVAPVADTSTEMGTASLSAALNDAELPDVRTFDHVA
ncbi:MAG TPA: HD domain-containing phosphohydrolase [Bryobacteraceae bacterium]|nr:HD domain-containing phosphohydrolase [Bryobacteraceae bacterium]